MKKLSILLILIMALSMSITACASLNNLANDIDDAEDELDATADVREEELDATADAFGDSFDVKGGIFDDIGDDIDYVAGGSSDDDIDNRADEVGNKWDDRGDALDDKYDDDDVDIDVDIDSDPGVGTPGDAAPDDVAYGICNAMNSLDNSVAGLLSPDLTTPEAYTAAFDVAQEDFWKLREAAHGQYTAEFDEIVNAAVGFEVILTSDSDDVQRSDIVIQAGRIAFADNALNQQINCSCSP